MHRQRWVFAILFLFVIVLVLGLRQNTSSALKDAKKKKKEAIEWTTIDKGLELASKQNKLLVVDVYTDWCHWCKVMDKETYHNKEVVKWAKQKVVMARLNAETNNKFKFKDRYFSGRELASLFGVSGFPTTLFFSAKGELLSKVPGFIPADTFNLILKYLSEDWYKKMEFDEFLKKESGKG